MCLGVVLTDNDHDGGVYHVRLMTGRIALDAITSAEVACADLGILLARERLKNLHEYKQHSFVKKLEREHSFVYVCITLLHG